jgi:hypothetical protein
MAHSAGDVFEAAGAKWWIVALLRSQVIALRLSQQLPRVDTEIKAVSSEWLAPAGSSTLGKVLDTFHPSTTGVDVLKFLSTKAPLRSWSSEEYLRTGFCAVDLFSPLMIGQSVLFKGRKNTGKFEVSMSTASEFLKLPNSAVVVALPNPQRKAAVVAERLGERAVVYAGSINDSDVSQALLVVAALANAVTLKNEGKRVLLVVDDIHYMYAKELTCFAELGYTPYNFQHLAYEHTKSTESHASLTTIQVHCSQIMHDFAEFPAQFKTNVESLAQRLVHFSGTGVPAFDALQTYDRVHTHLHPPIFAVLQEGLREVLTSVRESASAEDIKQRLGMYTEPWDKYLLLDSAYFMPMLNHTKPLGQFQQVLWLRFIAYTVEHELASSIKLTSAQIHAKFFEFASHGKGLKQLEKDYLSLDRTSAVVALEKLDEVLNVPFYDELRRDGNLKPYREDYEHLMSGSSDSSTKSLSQGESSQPKQVLQERMESFFGLK